VADSVKAQEETVESPEEVILVDKHQDGQIWVITMNRPQRLNALGGQMFAELTRAFEDFRDDPAARVAILTGSGDRAFCAGADLKEVVDQNRRRDGSPPPRSGRLVPLSESLELWKPTIAAINGFAIAGGFMMAMQCDIRIMADHAKIGIAEVRWNMSGGGWMAPLTRQIGLGNALELVLWGDTQFDAQRALEIGWAQKVVNGADLMPTAMAYAERMLDMAPRAVMNKKQLLYRGYHMDALSAKTMGEWLERNLEGMNDSIEGPAAFAEKRRPRFRND
jgi:enoyl-CoA hydratase/carnithine racemase